MNAQKDKHKGTRQYNHSQADIHFGFQEHSATY